MSDLISQRRARRLRRAYHLARGLISGFTAIKENRNLSSWQGLSQRVRDEVATANKLGFVVEARVEGENLVLTAKRYTNGWTLLEEYDKANGGEL